MTKDKRSFCRLCLAACGINVTVHGDRVTTVRGDPHDPVSRGYVCPKGRGLVGAHNDNRLDGAFVRRDGQLRLVSRREGQSSAITALQAVLDRYGPGAVASFSGTGAFNDPMGTWALGALKASLGITQSYSTSTVDAVSKTLVAIEMAGATALIPHPDPEPNLLLLVGSNPVVSHGQSTPFANPVERIRSARASGTVWVIDPRRTETAVLADRHIAARPGTDYALLAHAVRAVFLQDGYDRDALSDRADGIEDLRRLVEPFDRDRVSELARVEPAVLDDLVQAILRAGRVAVVTGTGTTMARYSYLTEWMAWALMIITDSFDQPGGMWFNPGYHMRLDLRRPLRPVTVTGPGPPSHPDILPLLGEWPAAAIPEEIESGRLRALIVAGANPALALPDEPRLVRALQHLDALIVVDVAPTATTKLATHAFGCADQLERPDVPSLDFFAGALYTQWTDAVVRPSPDRPEMWRLFAALAEGLGHPILESGEDPDVLPTETLIMRVRRGVDPEAARKGGGFLYEAPAVYGWAQSHLPHGRWHLAPDRLAERLAVATDPPKLQIAPRRQTRRLNSFEFRAGDLPEAIMHPDDVGPEGINDGDLIDLIAEKGTLRLRVKVTDSIAAGTVSIPHGWGEANVNVLIDCDDIDPLTGMPVLSGTAVTVRPAATPFSNV